MSRPLPPLKGHLRRKIEPPKPPKSKSPPLNMSTAFFV